MDGRASSTLDRFCRTDERLPGGECLPWVVLEEIDVGTLVLDHSSQSVVVLNRAASSILKDIGTSPTYEGLSSLFLPELKSRNQIPPNNTNREIWSRGTVLGYSTYGVGEHFVCVFVRDITERARLEEIADVVNITDNTEYIFSCLRHEIGNPINTLKTTLTVLHDNLDRYSTNAIKESVRRGLTEIGRIEDLLRSLKTLSMFDQPAVEPVVLPVFLSEFLESMTDEFEEKGVTIQTALGPGARTVMADQQALYQCLQNLVRNALDAVEEQKTPEIALRASQAGNGLVRLTVADNGCGIGDGERPELFKPFFTTKAAGTGLGLFITRKMLAKMNSQIEIESSQDEGTRVTMTIPAEEGGTATPHRHGPGNEQTGGSQQERAGSQAH